MTSDKFLQGGGEMGELTRAYDWSKTSIGPPAQWPQSLRIILSILLNSKFPKLLMWGPDLIQFYNDSFRPSLGNNGKHPTALGQKGKDCWAEIWTTIQPLLNSVISGQGSIWSEDQLIPIYRNGGIEDVYWTFSYSAVSDDSGEVGGVLVTCMETTEKVQTLKAMNESREELQFTIDAAELGTWDLNPATNRFVGNKRLKEWFGITEHEEIPLTLAIDVIDEKDRDRVKEAIAHALDFSSGGHYNVDYSITNNNQEQRFVRAKGKALFNEDRSPLKFSGTLEDITEEMLAHQKLLLSEERLRIALDAGELGTFEVDFEFPDIMLTTPRFDNIFGFDQHVSRHEFANVIHPDDQQRRSEAHKESLVSGRLFYEARVIKTDGRINWIRVVGKVLFENNKPSKLLGILQDITEQKNLQEQQDNFIGIASHELKTPVTSIKAYTQVLEKMLLKKGDAQSSAMIGRLDIQLNRLTSLITDLLDITKINSGKLDFNRSVFSFDKLIEEMVEELQRTATTHKILIRLEEPVNIFADRERISQVITNFISNAVKYSPDSTEINIFTQIKAGEITFCVQDFGIGIRKESHEKVFDQFYRVTEGHSTFQGLGLGLYISAGIIQREGGKIWVESEEGKGSKFFFSLPVHQN